MISRFSQQLSGHKHNQKDTLLQGKRTLISALAMNGRRPEKFKAIVFDFDGTLAELHIDFGEMKRRLAALATEYIRIDSNGPPPPVLEWLEKLEGEVRSKGSGTAGDFRRRAEALIMEMELESALRGKLFEYSRQILSDLNRKNIKVAIITRNCEKAVRIVFPDIDSYCSVFLAREHVPRVKPDPDHLLKALEQVAGEPGTTLMVGDHPLDIMTGRRAGALTAGVSSGSSSASVLAASGATWTAGNCEELMQELERDGWV